MSDDLSRVLRIATALSKHSDRTRLLEQIVREAQALCSAEAGTLYTINDQGQLCFEILLNEPLNIHCCGPDIDPALFPPIDLQEPSHTVAAQCAQTGKTVNVGDCRDCETYDFSGTRAFDQRTGYSSQSFLTVPLRNHEDQVIGVLQLINRLDAEGCVTGFSHQDQDIIEALASLAAVLLTQRHLLESHRAMLESFIRMIAHAIDEKSPFTGQHCRRVPEIAMMIARAINAQKQGPFADVMLSPEQLYELEIAALLHDCGKVTTPVHVVDKATRLQTICDREELILTRLEVIRKQAELELEGDALVTRLAEVDAAAQLICQANANSTVVDEQMSGRLKELAGWTWRDGRGHNRSLLTEDELKNLTIERGTLNEEERAVINHHVVASIEMLEQIPYPRDLANVPEIAGAHHERVDGKGYPAGLTGEQMSLQAKVLALADVFEAVTASDRPYRKAIPLSKAMAILDEMQANGHIDPDVYHCFADNGIPQEYGRQHLAKEQCDLSPHA